MKKMFICASVIGLAASIVYWLCTKGRPNHTASKSADKKGDFETGHQKEDPSQNINVEEEMYQAKSESAQAVYERHAEASSIMKDAYSSIMEDFVEDFSGEKGANAKEKNKEDIINHESVPVTKEMDLISEELDDLLK